MNIQDFFKEQGRVAIAFSGGVDSAVLLLLAKKYSQDFKAYFVKTQFQPQFELDDALAISEQLGADMKIINLDVLSDTTIAANPENRCYYCKKRIFSAICSAAERDGFKCVCDGTNASDDIEDRPGFRALAELEVKSLLRDCGFTKEKIRAFAKENALPVADKPSYACLATRIPAGTPITNELLRTTESAEAEMRALGFRNFRVRYLNGTAKLELSKNDSKLFSEEKERVVSMLSNYYDGVVLDPKERRDE